MNTAEASNSGPEVNQKPSPFKPWTQANFFMLFLHILFLGDVDPVFSQRLYPLSKPFITYILLFLGHYWWVVFLLSLVFAACAYKIPRLQDKEITIPLFITLAAGLVFYLVAFYWPVFAAGQRNL